MMEWWNALPAVGRVFATIAIPATVVMILQTVLLLFGMGSGESDTDTGVDFDLHDGSVDLHDGSVDLHDGSVDLHDVGFDGHGETHEGAAQDGHHDGLSLFSIRGIVAFFSIGGWVGLVATVFGLHTVEAVVLSMVSGTAALFGVAWLFKNAMRLQDSGNLDLRAVVGKTGLVYLTVPAKDQGLGKVTVQLSAALVELDALNAGEQPIPTGAEVEICAIAGDSTAVVRALHIEAQTNRGGISKWS